MKHELYELSWRSLANTHVRPDINMFDSPRYSCRIASKSSGLDGSSSNCFEVQSFFFVLSKIPGIDRRDTLFEARAKRSRQYRGSYRQNHGGDLE